MYQSVQDSKRMVHESKLKEYYSWCLEALFISTIRSFSEIDTLYDEFKKALFLAQCGCDIINGINGPNASSYYHEF